MHLPHLSRGETLGAQAMGAEAPRGDTGVDPQLDAENKNNRFRRAVSDLPIKKLILKEAVGGNF